MLISEVSLDVSSGVWVVAYILNEVHENIAWIQVASRFLLLVMVCFTVDLYYVSDFLIYFFNAWAYIFEK